MCFLHIFILNLESIIGLYGIKNNRGLCLRGICLTFCCDNGGMKRIFITVGLLLLCNYSIIAYLPRIGSGNDLDISFEQKMFESHAKQLYDCINERALSYDAFFLGLKGYYVLKAQDKLKNPDVLTIIDFSKPANEDRFYLIDMLNSRLILKSLVAHGRNTGTVYATDFSNKPNSYQSSLGFFLTGETYTGAHGLSLRLDGTEKYINDNARMRDIVVHAADYVSQAFMGAYGRIGRSLGCPALPVEYISMVVETIKDGSCIFAYYPDQRYMRMSPVMNNSKYLEAFRKEQPAPAADH